eukprot:GHVT01084969.1.p1 GENE.GHVT01084969.1~~GHVT01084969.1.p1  ORF type:complete len:159 (-),score=6.40 GHVT01084969.1:1426-1902(-)
MTPKEKKRNPPSSYNGTVPTSKHSNVATSWGSTQGRSWTFPLGNKNSFFFWRDPMRIMTRYFSKGCAPTFVLTFVKTKDFPPAYTLVTFTTCAGCATPQTTGQAPQIVSRRQKNFLKQFQAKKFGAGRASSEYPKPDRKGLWLEPREKYTWRPSTRRD